jgi:hypothetical protein
MEVPQQPIINNLVLELGPIGMAYPHMKFDFLKQSNFISMAIIGVGYISVTSLNRRGLLEITKQTCIHAFSI